MNAAARGPSKGGLSTPELPLKSLALAVSSLTLALVACTTETIVKQAPAAASEEPAEPEPTPSPAPTSPGADAGADAAPAAPKAAWIDGKAGASCAAACSAAGKTCAVACADHPSCGGHDDVPGPYAGYACYYYEKKDASGSIRLNEGRSLLTCDELVTSTWSPQFSSTKYTLGSYVPALSPVSCCCE